MLNIMDFIHYSLYGINLPHPLCLKNSRSTIFVRDMAKSHYTFLECNKYSDIYIMVLLPGFSSQGSTGPIEKLKGGHEGENRSQFSDTVNSMFYSSELEQIPHTFFKNRCPMSE